MPVTKLADAKEKKIILFSYFFIDNVTSEFSYCFWSNGHFDVLYYTFANINLIVCNWILFEVLAPTNLLNTTIIWSKENARQYIGWLNKAECPCPEFDLLKEDFFSFFNKRFLANKWKQIAPIDSGKRDKICFVDCIFWGFLSETSHQFYGI